MPGGSRGDAASDQPHPPPPHPTPPHPPPPATSRSRAAAALPPLRCLATAPAEPATTLLRDIIGRSHGDRSLRAGEDPAVVRIGSSQGGRDQESGPS